MHTPTCKKNCQHRQSILWQGQKLNAVKCFEKAIEMLEMEPQSKSRDQELATFYIELGKELTQTSAIPARKISTNKFSA
jgi:hypothetical protein